MFPGFGSKVNPFEEIPPRRFTSITSLNSVPNPKVPEAAITGFSNFIPAIVTDKSGFWSCFSFRGENGFSAKMSLLPSKTGPSLQQRLFPSVVVIVQPKQAPTPQAILCSILK